MTGLIVGRFQPFHRGHLAVVTALRSAHPSQALVLAVGSAQESFTAENPFTAGERLEMIQLALEEAHVEGCQAIPVPDIHQHAQWAAYLRGLLPSFDVVYTNNPLTRVLFERDGLRVESPALVDRHRWQGTVVRQLMRDGGSWKDLVPPGVAGYLERIGGPERLRRISAPRD